METYYYLVLVSLTSAIIIFCGFLLRIYLSSHYHQECVLR